MQLKWKMSVIWNNNENKNESTSASKNEIKNKTEI